MKAKPKVQQEQSHIRVVQQEACVNSRLTLKSIRSSPMSTLNEAEEESLIPVRLLGRRFTK